MIRATVCFCFVMCSWVWASNEDYKLAVAKEAEAKQTGRDARIWSQRCQRKGLDVLAKQKDGGKWEITCIPKRVLTVGA